MQPREWNGVQAGENAEWADKRGGPCLTELHRQELLENFAGLQLDNPRYRKIEPLS